MDKHLRGKVKSFVNLQKVLRDTIKEQARILACRLVDSIIIVNRPLYEFVDKKIGRKAIEDLLIKGDHIIILAKGKGTNDLLAELSKHWEGVIRITPVNKMRTTTIGVVLKSLIEPEQ